jgi:putative FmdB family regulatory protein
MPIYEYWCSHCRSQFDKLRTISSNDAEVKCPTCGSNVKRMLSMVAPIGKSSISEDYSPVRNTGGCACGGSGCGCRAN